MWHKLYGEKLLNKAKFKLLYIHSEYSQVGFLEVMADEFGRISDISFFKYLDYWREFFLKQTWSSNLDYV